MSKPIIHATSSANKHGGTPDEYLHIHDFMDSTKSACADVRHRAVLHSAFGIFIVEKVFGVYFTNSAGKKVSVRDIAEQHVQEDLGFIPSLEHWIKNMPIEDWMMGKGRGKKQFIPMEDVTLDGQFNQELPSWANPTAIPEEATVDGAYAHFKKITLD